MRSFAITLLIVFGLGATVFAQSSPHAETPDSRRKNDDWFRHGRAIQGQPSAALRYRAYLQKLALGKSHPSNPSATWTPLGPAPLASDATGLGQQDYGWVSGRATAIAVDPSDATGNTVFIGGAYGGVWKSANAGPASANPASVVWTALTDNQATLAVGAIAVQPWSSGVQSCVNNPPQSIVLIGTGETDSSQDSYYGLGILHSADGGQTWDLVASDSTGTRSFAGLGLSKIAFSTSTPNLVVAAAAATSQGVLDGLENPVGVNRGIYYAPDCGETWTYANIADNGVVISPSSATSVIYNAGVGLFFAAVRYHGFYSSPDGINWTRLLNQPGAGLTSLACPPQTTSPSECPIYRGEMAVVPGRNEMYVWYVDANDVDQGIWQSFDGGVTWAQIDETGILDCGDLFGGCGAEDGTYNLELAAVPNCAQSDPSCGVTDLYAGAVNIFKCELSPEFPTCNPNVNPPPPPNAVFLNLTHVYGCPPDFGSTAHVHASQHAIGFELVQNNQQVVMYFANDGGIYRALNGFTDLDTGTCGQTNDFDSLNQTLGSMTQLVGFSQSPNDPNTLLAGAQANGSPATGSAEGGTTWQNVNEPDGGFTLINPANALEWFTENTGISIQKCELGLSCTSEDFNNGLIVSNATLGGDMGPLFTPFIFDPQSDATLVVGTCRVWRGSTDGTGFIAVSDSFDTGAPGTCTGQEVNQVRALAAGGPVQGGFSNVIYAGTDGYGPNATQSPTGGHVLVTTNALLGPNSWMNQTGTINPDFFPVSAIALDPTDPTGNTAYVSIMGFGVSHIWQTTNAGVSWNDFTGTGSNALPDAPANAIALDTTQETLYVGTDVGVFSTSTSTPSWNEVGPAAQSGQSGFLPNVAVTELELFNAQGEKLLRASTYGRGVWETPLVATADFQITVSNNPLTAFTGTQGVFQITVNALNGYSGNIQFTCLTGLTAPPSTCNASGGAQLGGGTNSANLTVTVGGAPTTYNFYLKGADQNGLSHEIALTFAVEGFSLGAPIPPSVTLGSGATSGPISILVSATGPFSAGVNLTCTPPPNLGVNCGASPTTVFPTSTNPAQAILTVSTSATSPAGQYTLTIGAASNPAIPGEPAITQPLGLTISPDFALTMNNTSANATEGFPATFTGSLGTQDGYSSLVNLSCGSGAPPTCVPNPASVVPTQSGSAFVVTVESGSVANYNFNLIAQGTDQNQTAHSVALIFASTKSTGSPDFAITISNPLLTAEVNSDAVFMGTLTALDGYSSPVNLSCGAGSPPDCTPSPLTLAPNAAGAPFTVTVNSKTAAIYDFNIVAQGTDGSRITHSTAVVFESSATFSFVNNTAQQTTAPGQAAQYSLSIAPLGGSLQNAVDFSCDASSLPAGASCQFKPATVAAGSGTTTVALMVNTSTATPVGTSHITVAASSGAVTTDATPSPILTVMGNGQGTTPFVINNTTGTQTVAPGEAITYILQVSSGDSFTNDVSFACSGLPAAASCAFSPAQVTPGTIDEPSITTLTITTTAQVIAFVPGWGYGLAVLLPVAFVTFGARRARRRWARALLIGAVVGIFPSCGGGTGVAGGQAGTPTGTYTVTVTGSSGVISETAAPPVGLVVQ
ncbi:MAG: hypothetical protein ABSE92_00195 [Terriglobales bacterium]